MRRATIESLVLGRLADRDLYDTELSAQEMRAVRRLRTKGRAARSVERDPDFGWSWRYLTPGGRSQWLGGAPHRAEEQA